MATNRFPARCMECSVEVFANGGTLRRADDGKWDVLCPVCESVRAEAERAEQADTYAEVRLPAHLPAACAPTISVRVLTLNRECWKCGRETVCVVGLYPVRPARGDDWPRSTSNEDALGLARDLLRQAGLEDLAAPIKPRWSGTLGSRYLSNGCQHCGALQGDFPLGEEVSERMQAGGVDALGTALVVDLPSLSWQRIVHGEEGSLLLM